MSVLDFDFSLIQSAVEKLNAARRTLTVADFPIKPEVGYTAAPTLAAAFTAHDTFRVGQPGSARTNVAQAISDADFLFRNLDSQLHALRAQETSNRALFDSPFELGERLFGTTFNSRTPKGVVPLTYAPGLPGAEAAMPLQALISAYSTGDQAAYGSAAQWRKLAANLEQATILLHQADAELSTARGTMFDFARQAIGQVRTAADIFNANAALMATSVETFPAIRAANHSELLAIQASTAAIPEPEVKLAAAQSAVASWARSALPASLAPATPPVVQFTTPVTAGTLGGYAPPAVGGNVIEHRLPVHRPNGINQPVIAGNTGGLGNAARAAADQAGRGDSAVVQAASTATAPVPHNLHHAATPHHTNPSQATSTAAQVQQFASAQNPVASAPTAPSASAGRASVPGGSVPGEQLGMTSSAAPRPVAGAGNADRGAGFRRAERAVGPNSSVRLPRLPGISQHAWATHQPSRSGFGGNGVGGKTAGGSVGSVAGGNGVGGEAGGGRSNSRGNLGDPGDSRGQGSVAKGSTSATPPRGSMLHNGMTGMMAPGAGGAGKSNGGSRRSNNSLIFTNRKDSSYFRREFLRGDGSHRKKQAVQPIIQKRRKKRPA